MRKLSFHLVYDWFIEIDQLWYWNVREIQGTIETNTLSGQLWNLDVQ